MFLVLGLRSNQLITTSIIKPDAFVVEALAIGETHAELHQAQQSYKCVTTFEGGWGELWQTFADAKDGQLMLPVLDQQPLSFITGGTQQVTHHHWRSSLDQGMQSLDQPHTAPGGCWSVAMWNATLAQAGHG